MAKILVVDDEEDVRSFLKMHLEDNGHEVKCAEDGLEGFDLVKSFNPDLAILDIIMPMQSGINLYNKIRKSQKYRYLPVIILSAVVRYREQFAEQYGKLPQPDAYMDKPFDPVKLIELIKRLIK